MYSKGSSLKLDLATLVKNKPQATKKLANRIYEIIIRVDAITLARQLWGIHGKSAGNPTNFHLVTELLGKVGGGGVASFSTQQAQKINEKLYRNKLVDTMHFVS
jgi:hypothetical protein